MKWTICLASLAVLAAAAFTGCGRSRPADLAAGDPPAAAAALAGPSDAALGAGSGRAAVTRQHDIPRRGFGRGGGRSWGQRRVHLSADEERVIGLSTVEVGHRVLRAPLRTMGTVYAPPARMAIVSYPFPARVARVHVGIGDWVREGQALVDLQADEVATTKAAYQQTRTALELAESSHAREQRLVERGVGARKELLVAENELKLAHAAVEAAEKRLQVPSWTG